MTDKTWKKFERDIAKALGGQRIPASGAAQFPNEKGDVLHKIFEIECKYRSKILVSSWFKEVVERASETGKIPLLAIREKGMKNGALIVLKLDDFVALTGYSPERDIQKLKRRSLIRRRDS